jgi:hypothetical protein
MAKINTGTITAAGNGSWSSNAIAHTAGPKRTYMYVNGVQAMYRDFTASTGIVRDTGSAFPLSVTSSAVALASLSVPATSTLTTAAANTTIVVTVAWSEKYDPFIVPPTVAWVGGNTGGKSAFTRQVMASDYLAAPSDGTSGGVSIWTATCSSAITNQQIIVTPGATGQYAGARAISVDALTGASLTGIQSATLSASASGVTNLNVTGVTAGSWIYVGFAGDYTASLTLDGYTVAGTTKMAGVDETALIYLMGYTGINTAGASGTVNVGWSVTQTARCLAALEIKAA